MTAADEHAPYGGDDDFVAAEYVLGVLPAAERAAAARRVDEDPAFARLVEAWEERLSPMADSYAEVEPPASVRAALERRLFAETAQKKGGFAALWQSVTLWRSVAALSLAAVAVLAVLFFAAPPGQAPDQRFVASLAPADSDVHYVAVYDPGHNDIGLSHVSGARPEGRDFELWVIEGGEPRSLGVIPVGSSVHLAVTEALEASFAAEATLAITAEPAGGSPTGLPTGPVVAQGGLSAI